MFQMVIYGTMKIIKRERLSIFKDCVCTECRTNNYSVCSERTDPDIFITSYHIKTIIFWVIENSPSTLWKKERFFECMRFCLQMLMSCVEKNICRIISFPAEIC